MKKAFTIVELLVVMAVIGILITLAVVGIQAVQKSQREVVRQNDLRNVSAVLANYYTKFKAYPRSESLAPTGAAIVASAGTNINFDGKEKLSFSDVNLATSTNTNYSVTLAALGVKFVSIPAWGNGTLPAAGCTVGATESNTGDPLSPSADQWYILYRASTATPQSYTLAACTENGWSANQGTKID